MLDWDNVGFKVREGKATTIGKCSPSIFIDISQSTATLNRPTPSRLANGPHQNSSSHRSSASMEWHLPSTTASSATRA